MKEFVTCYGASGDRTVSLQPSDVSPVPPTSHWYNQRQKKKNELSPVRDMRRCFIKCPGTGVAAPDRLITSERTIRKHPDINFFFCVELHRVLCYWGAARPVAGHPWYRRLEKALLNGLIAGCCCYCYDGNGDGNEGQSTQLLLLVSPPRSVPHPHPRALCTHISFTSPRQFDVAVSCTPWPKTGGDRTRVTSTTIFVLFI